MLSSTVPFLSASGRIFTQKRCGVPPKRNSQHCDDGGDGRKYDYGKHVRPPDARVFRTLLYGRILLWMMWRAPQIAAPPTSSRCERRFEATPDASVRPS